MPNELFDLKGKTALVTGGTRGLGMTMARGLGEAGAFLVINGTSESSVNKGLRQFEEWKLNARGYAFNVADEPDVKKNVSLVENEVGPIDILVNNAGIIKRSPLEDMDTGDFRDVV
ncbi:MAG: SDR family NAD(P)-dependent oxidoreductase, partial [Bacteroidales bacterium]